MKLKKLIFISFLTFLLLLSGCAHVTIPSNANAAFENFTLCLFQQEVASNSINLHYSLQNPEKCGITTAPITLGSFDFDETAALASIENLEASLRKFSYSSLSEKNQLTYDILLDHFSKAKTDISYYLYDEPLSPVTGIHAQLPVLLAEYQFSKTEDVETYLSLLETLPEYFGSLLRFEQKKCSAGLFMSEALVDAVVNQCNAFINMGEENYLLSTFEERLNNISSLSEQDKTAYVEKNQSLLNSHILPAYENLASSLLCLKESASELNGLSSLPKGRDYYSHLVAMDTGSARSISELKVLIQNQIATDLLDSQKILRDNPSVLQTAETNSQSPEVMLKTLESKIELAFPQAASVNVQVKYVPSALEKYLSPAFYLIPSIDNFTENTIYINQAYSMNDLDLFTTLAHEGYPGHLYQTTYFSNTNPDPVRTLFSCSGYVEGWATYAEMCSYYLSSLKKPYATLLQKNNSLLLGLYASADIGIHYDKWSLSDTIEFFSAYGIKDETAIQEIYEYIVGDPANYLIYYVGYLEILELKKDMITQKGTAFSQKDFHKKVLELGPAPFKIIRKHLF